MRSSLKAVLALVRAHILRWSRARVGLALGYHRVEETAGDPERDLVPVISTADFARQVEHLARRYHVVPASELYAATLTRTRGQRLPVAITFDDDLRTHVTKALPVLRHRALPATFFLCGASLTGPHSFWWERLQRCADDGADINSVVSETVAVVGPTLRAAAAAIEELSPGDRTRLADRLRQECGPDPADAGLRAADVRRLASSGMEIGFHTREHHPLTGLDGESLARALEEGRDELARMSGAPLTVLAYPHSRADGRTVAAARQAGYRCAFTGGGSPIHPSSDTHLLGRADSSHVPPDHFPLWLTRRLREGIALGKAHTNPSAVRL